MTTRIDLFIGDDVPLVLTLQRPGFTPWPIPTGATVEAALRKPGGSEPLNSNTFTADENHAEADWPNGVVVIETAGLVADPVHDCELVVRVTADSKPATWVDRGYSIQANLFD